MSPERVPEGLLPLDKPVGPTSHDLVSEARRALGVRRIGHTGTLDPFASGLLLLLIGRATRLVEYLHDHAKEYEATARFGAATTTDDPEGDPLEESEGWRELDEERILGAMARFRGELLQQPPVYSAKKVRGRPAHRRVREGEVVELPPVRIVIHEMTLLNWSPPDLSFRVLCSTGTYVRALGRDLARALGTHAHLVALRRTAVGPIRVEGALTPSELTDPARVARTCISPLEALPHLPRLGLESDDARAFEAGRSIRLDTLGAVGSTLPATGPVAVETEGRLLAVAESKDGLLKPRKVFPEMAE